MTETVRPFDLRLMQHTSALLLLCFALLCALAGLRWVTRLGAFDIQRITVLGETRHNNSLTLRANVAPRIAGNFFSVDLARVRTAFEAVPWVRRAVVQREFPNHLRVLLQEHQPVGLWGGDGEQRLINSYGEVFEANVGEVDQDNLPMLSGPDGQAAEVLAMYRLLQPAFAAKDLPLTQLALSGRGSWSARLDNGAALELGRGSAVEVQTRTQRFLETMTQVASRYGRGVTAIESADLRHGDGYALRLRGITTTQPPAKTN